MNKIIFECITPAGDNFSISMESDNRAQLLDAVPATVAAYRLQGIEVFSANVIEEMAIDLSLNVRPATQPERRSTSWKRHMPKLAAVRPMWVAEKFAAFGGVTLAVLGFDNGLSVANLAAHAESMAGAITRLL